MSKHTPGPWRRCGGFTPAYCAIHSNDGYIVFGLADPGAHTEQGQPIKAPDTDTQHANARLIAAAPDLLEALKKLDNFFETYRPEGHPVSDPHELVRAAIAKAEGT